MRLLSNRKATPSTRIIRIGLEGEAYSYRAGQAAWVGLDETSELTPYSIASSPEETTRHGWLEFLVKVDGSTRFGARVSTLRHGTPILVSPPAGSFVFPDETPEQRFLFVGGGTGIAPLRAMIRHALDRPVPGSIALLYSARVPTEFAYAQEFRALAREGRITLVLTLTGAASRWRHARGRAGLEHLAPLVAGTPPLCFVCGPASMMAEIPGTLQSLGVPPEKIRTEQW